MVIRLSGGLHHRFCNLTEFILLMRDKLAFLKPVEVPSCSKKRYGANSDGGYVLIDLPAYDALYSYGIGDNISFDLDFVSQYDAPVFCYDHTISSLPDTGLVFPVGSSPENNVNVELEVYWNIKKDDVIIKSLNQEYADTFNFTIEKLDGKRLRFVITRTDVDSGWGQELMLYISPRRNKLHWKQEGLSGRAEPGLGTLEQHIMENGHMEARNLLLKVDVEGSEWEVFDGLPVRILKKFQQVVVEWHGIAENNFEYSADKKWEVLNKLHKHFHVIHVHQNNWGPIHSLGEFKVPTVLEVTYLRRDPEFVVAPSVTNYPMEGLDFANRLSEDLPLDFYPFLPGD